MLILNEPSWIHPTAEHGCTSPSGILHQAEDSWSAAETMAAAEPGIPAVSCPLVVWGADHRAWGVTSVRTWQIEFIKAWILLEAVGDAPSLLTLFSVAVWLLFSEQLGLPAALWPWGLLCGRLSSFWMVHLRMVHFCHRSYPPWCCEGQGMQ